MDTALHRSLLFEFEGLRLDPDRRLLNRIADGTPIVLPPKVFDTLLYLVEHRNELLTKDALLEALWPGTAAEENSLNQNVSLLRKLLGEKPAEHRFIVTVPRHGYRFVADVRSIEREPPSTAASLAARERTPDAEANACYLQARALYVLPDESRLRQAMTLLNQAMARQPRFPAALSLMAAVRVHCVLFGYPLANALDDAERDANLAIEIDPELLEAHAVLGQINAFRGRWEQAETHFRRSLDSASYDPVIAVIYCTCLLIPVGHLDRAEREIQRAHELAPASVPVAVCSALLSCLRHDDAEAIRHLSLSVALGGPMHLAPNPQIRSHAARRAGRFAEAAQHIIDGLQADFRARRGAEAVTAVHQALADPQRTAAAVALIRNIAEKAPQDAIDPISAKDLMVWCTLLGSVDLAHDIAARLVSQLERARMVGGAWDALWLPEMKPFRRHDRFQSLATRLGFFDYWKRYGAPFGCELRQGTLVCH